MTSAPPAPHVRSSTSAAELAAAVPGPLVRGPKAPAAGCHLPLPFDPGDVRAFFRRWLDGQLENASDSLEESQDFHPLRLAETSRLIYRATSATRHHPGAERAERKLNRALMSKETPIFILIRGPEGPRVEAQLEAALRRFLADPREEHRQLPAGLAPPYHRVWRRLLECHDLGQPLVGLFVREHPVETGTELLARKMIASAIRRRGHLAWAYRREAEHHRRVRPWLLATRPDVVERLDRILERAVPRWLCETKDYPRILGWQARGKVKEALQVLRPPAAPNPEALAAQADLLVGLHHELVTGVQSYWLKLLRDASAGEQRALISRLVELFYQVNLLEPEERRRFDHAGLESPAAKGLRYERTRELKAMISETLYGLGQTGEGMFRELVGELSRRHRAALTEREHTLAEALPGYRPVDLEAVLADPLFIEEVQGLLDEGPITRRSVLTSAPGEVAPLAQAALEHLRFLSMGAALLDEVDFRELRASPALADGAWVGLCPNFGNRAAGRTRAPASILGPAAVAPPPPPAAGPRLGTSVVFAGAGGRGPLFIASFEELLRQLATQQGPALQIDEYVGASAGAVVAGLLAAGYAPGELLEVMRKVDFSESLDDFFALGGVSPGVRGIRRNGLFSTRTMYDIVHQALADKLGIHGRPILFKDLPYELKIPVIVVSTDLPAELRRELGIHEADREWVLSKAATPYVDVAAAIVASAAPVPFFETPKLHLLHKRTSADGTARFERYSARLADGGTTNKRPYSLAEKDRSFLLTFACVNQDGEDKVTTVDLSCQQADRYIALNRRFTEEKVRGLGGLLADLEGQGYRRAVLSFHMSLEHEPVGLLGHSAGETAALGEAARARAFPLMDPEALRFQIEDDRIGVNLPELALFAVRFFPPGFGPENHHPSWVQCLNVAASALSEAKRGRQLTESVCPRR